MLGTNQDVVDSERNKLSVFLAILNDDLGLAVGAQPRDVAIFPLLGHNLTKLV